MCTYKLLCTLWDAAVCTCKVVMIVCVCVCVKDLVSSRLSVRADVSSVYFSVNVCVKASVCVCVYVCVNALVCASNCALLNEDSIELECSVFVALVVGLALHIQVRDVCHDECVAVLDARPGERWMGVNGELEHTHTHTFPLCLYIFFYIFLSKSLFFFFFSSLCCSHLRFSCSTSHCSTVG